MKSVEQIVFFVQHTFIKYSTFLFCRSKL